MRYSERARERGFDQLGTLGAGNHFVEVQVVDEVFDEQTAQAFGLFQDQICIMVHTGSRGFGYQVCTDFLPVMDKAAQRYGIALPDRQLACAPLTSREGQALPGGDGVRGEFCLGQPADDAPSRGGRAGRGNGQPRERCGFGWSMTCATTSPNIEEHHGGRPDAARVRASQGRNAQPAGRASAGAATLTGTWGSQC